MGRNKKERYELYHGVKIHDQALITAAVLSHRYISDRFLPLPEDYPYKTNNISTIKIRRTAHQYITIFTDKGESFTTDVTSGWITAIEKDTHGIIGMITYFNPFRML